jgi:hypothetical protein
MDFRKNVQGAGGAMADALLNRARMKQKTQRDGAGIKLFLANVAKGTWNERGVSSSPPLPAVAPATRAEGNRAGE